MALHPRSGAVNPLLGIYFGIFGAILMAVVVVLLIFEQLGASTQLLRLLTALGSISLYVAIGCAAYNATPAEFFLAGRRVPAAFNGVALCISGLGSSGLVAISGLMLLIGFDALCLAFGILGGFVAMLILIAPFVRKFGAPSIPGYLGRRFESASVRLAAASLAVVPLVLFLVAEIKIAIMAVTTLLDVSATLATGLIVIILTATLVPGGARSLAWSSAAQSIAAIVAVLVPAAIIATMITNLPLGQLSHGPALRSIMRSEIAQNVPLALASAFSFELPDQGFHSITSRFASPFGHIGPMSFILAILALMLGTASSPVMLPRAATSPTVFEARKSLVWAVVLVSIIILTLSANAVFLRDMLFSLAGDPIKLSQQLRPSIDLGLVTLDGSRQPISALSVEFKRDSLLLALPVIAGLPVTSVYLVAAGILAAALAAAAASLFQLAVILGEDVVAPINQAPPSNKARLLVVRLATVMMAALAAWIALATPGDPLQLLLWSLSLSGAAFFPVLLLSVWWKRLNAWGALAGMLAGFGVGVMAVLVGELTSIGLPGSLAAIAGVPVGIAVALVISHITPAPGRHVLELVREVRVPGGEAVYDRENRLAEQKRRHRG